MKNKQHTKPLNRTFNLLCNWQSIAGIFVLLMLFSCKKEQVVDTDDPSKNYVWPTTKWAYEKPENVKVNPVYLDSLHTKINNEDYGNVHSLLIVKDGYLIFENYYNGSAATDTHELQSAAKSIASVLAGIAMDKNYFSENDFVINLIDTQYHHDNDARRNKITIKNVLDMRLGMEWKEWGYPVSEKDNILMANASDWIQYLLNKPMATTPNTSFLYNTGASCFISTLIDWNSPMNTKDFSNQYLFAPIGIHTQNWWIQDTKGIVHTGGGLKLTAADMARFGLLVLNEGKWDGKQIFSQTYFSKLSHPTSLNVLSVPVNAESQTLHYAYHFWNIPMKVNKETYNIIAAMGTGGQAIFIIQALNLVVVTTAWNLTEPFQTSSPLEWLKNFIIPAAH